MKKYYIFFAVLTAIIVVVSIIETKSSREPLKDQQKETDISSLQNAVDAYSRKNFRLPAKLSELELDDKLKTRLNDYEYKAVSGEKYEICATFKTDTTKGQPSSSYYSDDFSYPAYHKKGRQCFNRTSYGLSDSDFSGSSSNSAGLSDLFNPSTGISEKADDLERETAIKAIHAQLEVYYTDTGYYPTLANLNDANWRATNLTGLDKETLKDPKGTKYELAAVSSSSQYGYVVTDSGGGTCDNSDGDLCEEYTLSARLTDGTTYSKVNLN